MKKIALIFGGEGYEHDISVASAENLASLINTEIYRIIYTVIDKNGNWYIFERKNGEPLSNFREDPTRLVPTYPVRLSGTSGFYINGEILPADAAIPCLHGDLGEDGTIYAALRIAHIPYVGQEVYAAAFANDKSISKMIAERLCVPTAKWIDTHGDIIKAKQDAEEKIGYPMFIKPTRLGSSYGAHPVFKNCDFESAYEDARSYSPHIIIEEYIDFEYEIECAFFEGEQRYFHPHGRILSGKFYDYSAKYGSNARKTAADCGFDAETEEKVSEYSRRIADFLGLKHLSRLDFFVTSEKEIYFNEINCFPGMTENSLYPAICKNCRHDFINYLISGVINDRRI